MTWRNSYPHELKWEPLVIGGKEWSEFLADDWNPEKQLLVPIEHALRVRAGARYACARLRLRLALVRLEWDVHIGGGFAGSPERVEFDRARRVVEKMQNQNGHQELDWNYDTKPPDPGLYAVLVRLEDGRLVVQTERWQVHGFYGSGWWGDGRPGAGEQDGTVVAWRENRR